MLVFFDESGDPGLKLDRGSSKFFIEKFLFNFGRKKTRSYPSQRNAHHTVTARTWVNSKYNIY